VFDVTCLSLGAASDWFLDPLGRPRLGFNAIFAAILEVSYDVADMNIKYHNTLNIMSRY
jgi:hypothetical protein